MARHRPSLSRDCWRVPCQVQRRRCWSVHALPQRYPRFDFLILGIPPRRRGRRSRVGPTVARTKSPPAGKKIILALCRDEQVIPHLRSGVRVPTLQSGDWAGMEDFDRRQSNTSWFRQGLARRRTHVHPTRAPIPHIGIRCGD